MNGAEERKRLVGWKEIAGHLRVSERTARRWEQSGMPVHRVFPEQKSTVYAWVDELEAWMARQSEAGVGERDGKGRLWWMGGVAALLAVALGGGVWWWSAEQARRAVVPLLGRPLVISRALDHTPAISPDGSRVVFSRKLENESKLNLWMKELEGDREWRLSEADGVERGAVWSPDGKTLGFLRRAPEGLTKAIVLNVESRQERVLLEFDRTRWLFPNGPEVVFAPDGRKLIVCRHVEGKQHTEVVAVEVADRKEQVMLRLTGEIAVAPTLAPDGKKLGLLVRSSAATASESTFGLAVWDLDENLAVKGERQRLSPEGVNCPNHVWVGNRELLVLVLRERGRRLVRVNVDAPEKIRPLALADGQVNEVAYHAGRGLLVYSRYSWDLDTVGYRVGGEEVKSYGQTKDNEFALSYRPGGGAVALASGGKGPMEIFVQREGETARSVTKLGAEMVTRTAWQKQKEEILFLALVGTKRGLYRTDLVAGVTERVAPGVELGTVIETSADPEMVFALTKDKVLAKVWWKTGKVEEVVRDVKSFGLHPGGEKLYWVSGVGEVLGMDLKSRERVKIWTGPALSVAVSKEHVWVQQKEGAQRMSVWRMGLDGSGREATGVVVNSLFEGLAVKEDGSEVAVVVFRDFDSDLMTVRWERD